MLKTDKLGEENSIKRKSVTASKKDYEAIWQLSFIFISIFSAILIQKVYLYQTLDIFVDIRKGSVLDLLFYSLPFAFIFGVVDIKIHDYLDPLCQKYYINTKKYSDPDARQKRCYTLVKWAFSIFYYIFSTIAAYLILKGTNSLPSWLGGHGSCMNIYVTIPYMPDATFQMKHLSRAFNHIFIRAQGNFYEYALHHGLSTFLIMFSYLMNYWIVGVFVLLLHDCSDICLILCRGYREYKYLNNIALVSLYIPCTFIWLFTRIFVFSACCIYPSLHGALTYLITNLTQQQYDVLLIPSWFMVVMLMMLLVLQIFWTYYIARSVISSAVSQKIATHNYD